MILIKRLDWKVSLKNLYFFRMPVYSNDVATGDIVLLFKKKCNRFFEKIKNLNKIKIRFLLFFKFKQSDCLLLNISLFKHCITIYVYLDDAVRWIFLTAL